MDKEYEWRKDTESLMRRDDRQLMICLAAIFFHNLFSAVKLSLPPPAFGVYKLSFIIY